MSFKQSHPDLDYKLVLFLMPLSYSGFPLTSHIFLAPPTWEWFMNMLLFYCFSLLFEPINIILYKPCFKMKINL